MRGGRSLFVFSIASFIASVTLLTTGCPDDKAEPFCISTASLPAADCTPAYEPTYDAIYANTFGPTCGKTGFSCHGSTGHQGGIDFTNAEAAFSALTANDIVAGRPECSELVQRVVATDGNVRMPPGASIPIAEQCAIMKWVAAGAHR